MSKGAGYYGDRCRWLVRSASTSDTGQTVESFTATGYLWCSVQPISGRKQTDYGAEQTGSYATIRVRGYITSLSPLDRLLTVEWNEVWIIDTLRRGENEIICDCHRYDGLADYPIAYPYEAGGPLGVS